MNEDRSFMRALRAKLETEARTSFVLVCVEIAGRQHHHPIDPDACTEVYLVREPDNAFDSNAIRIVDADEGYMYGYVPRAPAEILALLLDNGHRLTASVIGVFARRVTVEIRMAKGSNL